MCNPNMLLLFIQLCTSFISTNNFTINQTDCIKYFDVCVDRQYWAIEEMALKPSNEAEAVIDICKYELFNEKLFIEYSTDNRCELKKIQLPN